MHKNLFNRTTMYTNMTLTFSTTIRIALIALIGLLSQSGMAQDKKAYQLYSSDGKKLDFSGVINQVKGAQILLFGELHNNPICHWLQFEVTKSLYQIDSNVVLGAEMFESDNQLVMDEYLTGAIKESHFKKEAKQWNNYSTDYRPLVEFAKKHQLPFVATNVPRRYASIMARKGEESLKELGKNAKKLMAPIPLKFDSTAPGYAEILQMDMGHGKMSIDFVKAQALKDATMAHFILKNYKKKHLFIHYNGDFHSKSRGGIYWYLKEKNKKLNVITISTVEADNLDWKQDYASLADIILVIPSSMTKTY